MVTRTAKLTNLCPSFPDRIGICSVVFGGGRKTGEPGKNPPSRDEYQQEPIKRSLHLPYKLYETSFVRISLVLETAGLIDSRTLYVIQYNIIQHNTTQHNTMHYTICFLGNVS